MSKTNCQPVDGVCSQCGCEVPDGRSVTCPDGPHGWTVKNREPCPHIGAETGETAYELCTSCCGTRRLKRAVCGCAVGGTCLPVFAGGALSDRKGGAIEIRVCRGCNDNPNRAAASQSLPTTPGASTDPAS